MESDTTAIELLDRLAKTWAKWIGPSGDREQYKRMSQFAADGAAALRERNHLRAELAAAKAERDKLRVRLTAETEKAKECMDTWKIAEERAHDRECDAINRAEKAEAENAALKAHVERLRGAIADMRERTNHPICISVLSATPAQSLAKLRAETLLEARSKLMPDVLGMGDYYAGMEAGVRSTMDMLQSMAEQMEREGDNE